MLREPLQELLAYWEKSGRPSHLKEVYCQGLYEGIIKDRWPCFQLNLIDGYPEFYSCVRAGLEKVWMTLGFRLSCEEGDPCLMIDSEAGDTIHFSSNEILQILELMKQKLSIPLLINGESRTVGLFPSKRARDIYQKIFWLDAAIQ